MTKKTGCKLAIFFGVFFLFFDAAKSQTRISDKKDDFLLLQISSGFLTIVKQARLDIDSCLMIASTYNRLSRIPVITEGIDGNYPLENYSWMDKGDIQDVIKHMNLLKGKEHVRQLLLLGAYFTFHPGLDKQYIDKAKDFLLKAKDEAQMVGLPAWVGQCDILLGKCYMKAGDIVNGKTSFQSAIKIAVGLKDNALKAKAYNYEGIYCTYIPTTLAFRIECLKKAVQLFRELHDPYNEANTLMDISYLNYASGNLKESEKNARLSFNIQQSIRFPYTHYSSDMLALITRINGNFAGQLTLAMDEVKSAETSGDSLGLAYFYARVAEAYVSTGSHTEESNFWYKKAFNQFIKQGGDPALYVLLAGKDFSSFSSGQDKLLLVTLKNLIRNYPPLNTIDEENVYMALATCFENLKQYKLAEKYLLMAEKLEAPNRLIRGDITQGYIYHRLGDLYVQMKDYKKSRLYNLKYTTVSKDSLILTAAYWGLFQADSAHGDFHQMANLYRYAMLKNQLYTKTKNRLVEELNIRYQTLQKQKDLETYKAKDLLQQQQAEAARRFSFAGLAILMLIILIIWLRYISKKKSNRQLQLQKNEITRKNVQLEQVISEKDELLISKEWLLKEVHHRVKNNLQLVMSLLNSQTTYLKDENALGAVMESQHRVQAMSLIHQKLYKSDNVSSIDMRDYIKELVGYLKDSFKTNLTIYFELKIEAIDLDVSQAIPLGLILNELITNAIKYAFPYTVEDRISISLIQLPTDELSLTVTDNGKGVPIEFDESAVSTFGMKLIKGLTEDLGGHFTFVSEGGTMANVVFKGTGFYDGEMESDLVNKTIF